jgi:hypothetical protein
MEGWRQERLGSRAGTHREEEKNKNILTRRKREKTEKQKQKNTLDSYRPSHGRWDDSWQPAQSVIEFLLPRLHTKANCKTNSSNFFK